jgi:hypothetical protein
MKHDTPGYVTHSHVLKTGPYPRQEIRCRIAIIVGKRQDLAASDLQSCVMGVSEPAPGLEHIDNGNGSDDNKILH